MGDCNRHESSEESSIHSEDKSKLYESTQNNLLECAMFRITAQHLPSQGQYIQLANVLNTSPVPYVAVSTLLAIACRLKPKSATCDLK